MRKLIPAVVLALVPLAFHPVAAQTQIAPKVPKSAAARGDNCAPIGRTANGELVYSMKCENLPAPVAPPPLPPQETRSGLSGWSYDRRQPERWRRPAVVEWSLLRGFRTAMDSGSTL